VRSRRTGRESVGEVPPGHDEDLGRLTQRFRDRNGGGVAVGAGDALHDVAALLERGGHGRAQR
jgi:hypothetical protein